MRLVLTFAAAAALAGAASAQNIVQLKSDRTPEQRAAAFDAADANKDGKLDLAEFKRALPPEILAQLPEDAVIRLRDARDTDNDGFLNRTEFLATTPVMIHQ
jgi:Ca2+-binding EF-hand superfamily protein